MNEVYLIVGLGNPGKEYSETRHNIGFMVVDELARRFQGNWNVNRELASHLARINVSGRRLWLCKPQTFMNLSGQAVQRVSDFYKIEEDHLMVIVDDADLPLGQIRLRPKGSSGGHHGLDSVEQHVSSKNYPRQRLGIAPSQREPGARQIVRFVLGSFSSDERPILDRVIQVAADQVVTHVTHGLQKAMNQFNGAVAP